MELIRKLGRIKHKNSSSSYGLFLCPHCGTQVEKILGQGRRNKSCGCLVAHQTMHGDSPMSGEFHSLYEVWQSMKQRCYNEKRDDYARYGKCHISVCIEWNNSYVIFKKWALNNGYEKGLTLDRIDNDGNYCPENCRFVTNLMNVRNSRATKLNMNAAREVRRKRREEGRTYKLLAEEYGVGESTIWNILSNNTWKEF